VITSTLLSIECLENDMEGFIPAIEFATSSSI